MDVDFHLLVPQSDEDLYNQWQTAIQHGLPESLKSHFYFVRTRLDDLPGTRFDAIVSPASCYGRMGEFMSFYFIYESVLADGGG